MRLGEKEGVHDKLGGFLSFSFLFLRGLSFPFLYLYLPLCLAILSERGVWVFRVVVHIRNTQ
jgi:hypothetical protein